MAGCTLPLSLRFLSFTWGQTCITVRVLSTLPRPLLILSHAVMSLNKIFACLILSRHLLNNRWRTQTNTPSLVPRAQKLSLNSSVWPFVIWLLLTSLFSFPLLLFYAPSKLIYSHSFNVLWSLIHSSVHMQLLFPRIFLSPPSGNPSSLCLSCSRKPSWLSRIELGDLSHHVLLVLSHHALSSGQELTTIIITCLTLTN